MKNENPEKNTKVKIVFYKENRHDKVWHVMTIRNGYTDKGPIEFSFDKKVIFNLFRDYPQKLTPEQKAIFDKENPFWADFFKDR